MISKNWQKWFRRLFTSSERARASQSCPATRGQPARRRPAFFRRPHLEELEDRTLLSTFNFTHLADDLFALQQNVRQAMAAASIPLIGQHLTDDRSPQGNIDQVSDYIGTVATKLRGLGDQGDPAQVQQNLPTDITLVSDPVISGSNLTLDLNLRAQHNSTLVKNFDLGLGSFLSVLSSGGVYLTVGLGFHLKFAYADNAGLTIDTNATSLSLTVSAQLTNPQSPSNHSSFDATLNGLLNAKATDNGGSHLDGTLGIGLDAAGTNPRVTFKGSAVADLHLNLGFDPSLHAPLDPHLSADLYLDWSLDRNGAPIDLGNPDFTQHGTINELSFKNVSFDVGLSVPSFLEPIVSAVQKFTKPLQPIIDFLDKEVPIISDFGVHERFRDLLEQVGVLSSQWNNLLDLIELVNHFSAGSNSGQGSVLLGDFSLQRDEITSVLSAVAGGAGQSTSDAHISTQNVQTTALDSVIAKTGGFIQQFLKKDGGSQDAGVRFPLFEDPAGSAFQLLMGRDKPLFTFQKHVEIPLKASLGVNFGILGLGLDAGFDLVVSLSMGYDTAGLRKAVAELLPGGSKDNIALDMLHGFYINNTTSTIHNPFDENSTVTHYATGLDLFGNLRAHLSFGATLTAGISAHVSAHLSSTDDRVRIDTLVSSFVDDLGCSFALSGSVSYYADLSLTVGAGPFKVTLFDYVLAQGDIVNFATTCGPSTSAPSPLYPQEIPVLVSEGSGTIRVVPYTNIDYVSSDRTLTRTSGIEVIYPGGDKQRYPTMTRTGIELYQGYGRPSGDAPRTKPPYFIVTNFGSATAPSGDHRIIIDSHAAADVEISSRVPRLSLSPQEQSRLLNAADKNETSWDGVDALLVGGPGNDDLEFHNPQGTATLVGGGGNDVLAGGTWEYGGFARSSPSSTPSISLFDSRVDPNIIAQSNASMVGSEAGQDRLIAPNSDAVLVAGPGNSYLQAGQGGVYTLDGGGGDNWFEVPAGTSNVPENVIIHGNGGNSTLHIRDAEDPSFLPTFGGGPIIHNAIGVDAGVSFVNVNEFESKSLTSPSSRRYTRLTVSADNSINGLIIDANTSQETVELTQNIPTSHLAAIAVTFSGGKNQLQINGPGNLFDQYTMAPDGSGDVLITDLEPGPSEFPIQERIVVKGLGANDEVVFNGHGGPRGTGDDYDLTLDSNLTRFTTTFDQPAAIGNLTIRAQGFTGEFGIGGSMSITDNAVTYATAVTDNQDNRVILSSVVNYYNQASQLTVYASNDGNLITVDRPDARGNTTVYGGSGGDDFVIKDGLRNINLYGGRGNDTFTVSGLGNYFLDGGDGEDRYTVNLAIYSDNSFATRTTISDSGTAGDNVVTVNGPAPGPRFVFTSYDVTNGAVLAGYRRPSTAAFSYVATSRVYYSGIAAVTVNTPPAYPSFDNTVDVNVESTKVDTAIDTSGPQTNVTVSARDNNLDNIQGDVHINGGTAATKLYIYDLNNPYKFAQSDQYTIGPDQVSRPNTPPTTLSATELRLYFPILFSNINALFVFPGFRKNHAVLVNSPAVPFAYVQDDGRAVADAIAVNGLVGALELVGNSSAGRITLGGPLQLTYQTLSAIKGSPATVDDSFTIVDNDSAAAMSGTFDNVAQNDVFQMSGLRFRMNYAAKGDGSQTDVQLKYLNTPPVITAITLLSPGGVIREQGLVIGSVVVTDPDPQDGMSFTVDWGDGGTTAANLPAGSRSLRLQHTYADENSTPYTVRVSVSDGHLDGRASGSTTVTVYDAPLTFGTVVPGFVENKRFSGVVATFTDPGSDGTGNDYKAGIDWGDGTRDDATVTAGPNHTFNVSGSHLYGGDDGTTYPLSVRVLDAGGASISGPYSWQPGPALLTSRQGGVAVRGRDGGIYLLGGFNAGQNSSFERLDPVTNTWTTLAGLPGVCYGIAAAAGNDGGIYLFGGQQYVLGGSPASKQAFRYDPATNTWSGIANLPKATSYAAAVTDRDGLIYVLGGQSSYSYMDTVQVYDPATGGWSYRVAMYTARSHLAAVLGPDGFIYALGGTNAQVSAMSNVEAFNPVLTSWRPVPSMTVGRADFAVARGPDGFIYALGGSQQAFQIGYQPTSAGTEAFDPRIQGWIKTADLTQARRGLAAAATADGRIYVLGGTGTTALASVEVLTHPLIRIADAPLTARGLPVIVSAGERIAFTGLVGRFTDPGSDGTANDYQATIVWGDGTSSPGTIVPVGNNNFTVNGSTAYASKGIYFFGVRIVDAGGSQLVLLGRTLVAEAPPVATSGSVTAIEGAPLGQQVVATFTDADPAATDYTASAVWDDGVGTSATVVADGKGGFQVLATRTSSYADEGTHSVRVTIKDTDSTATAAVISSITVADAPLTDTTASTTFTATSGTSSGTQVVATFNDANRNAVAGDFTATINWNDGTSTAPDITAGTVTLVRRIPFGRPTTALFQVSGNHTFAASGSYAIMVTVNDMGGRSTSTSNTSFRVLNPVLNDTTPATVINAMEGKNTSSQVVATFTDKNRDPATDLTAQIDWGDGTTAAPDVTVQAIGQTDRLTSFQVVGNHVYSEEGTYLVHVQISNKTGQSLQTGNMSFNIADAALTDTTPVQTLSATPGSDTGSQVVATFADANTRAAADDFTAAIDWGDGGASPDVTAGTVSFVRRIDLWSAFQVSGNHTYANPGTFKVGVTVKDMGGQGVGSSTTSFNVLSTFTVNEFPIPTSGGPLGITAGPDGNLWFTETGGNRIGEINPATHAVSEFPVTYNSKPYGIAVGPDDNIWFAEFAGAIGEINPATHAVSEFPVPTYGSNPFGVAAGPDGNLWFPEGYGNQIGEINPATHAISEFPIPTSSSYPTGITAGPDGNIWFTEANANHIGEINLATHAISEFPIPSGAFAITAGPDGNLWFVGGDNIGEINPATHAVTEFAVPTVGSNLVGISAGPDGNLWFTENYGNQIGEINPATHAVSEFAIPTANSYPYGITAGPDGNIWFAGSRSNRIGEVVLANRILNDTTPLTVANATEGSLTSLQAIATFTDKNFDAAANLTAQINWGDGSAGPDITTGTVEYVSQSATAATYQVRDSHRYQEEGTYSVRVRISNNTGQFLQTGNMTFTIADGALTDTTPVQTLTASPGSDTGSQVVATFRAADLNATADDFTVAIDWGDGGASPDVTTGTVSLVRRNDLWSAFQVTGNHPFSNPGTFHVAVTVKDKGGQSAGSSNTSFHVAAR